jgi:hypothetical protein
MDAAEFVEMDVRRDRVDFVLSVKTYGTSKLFNPKNRF